MNNFLAWLNGKKTIIGLVILQAVHLPFLADYPALLEFLTWIGGILTAVGFGHKVTKPGNP